MSARNQTNGINEADRRGGRARLSHGGHPAAALIDTARRFRLRSSERSEAGRRIEDSNSPSEATDPRKHRPSKECEELCRSRVRVRCESAYRTTACRFDLICTCDTSREQESPGAPTVL